MKLSLEFQFSKEFSHSFISGKDNYVKINCIVASVPWWPDHLLTWQNIRLKRFWGQQWIYGRNVTGDNYCDDYFLCFLAWNFQHSEPFLPRNVSEPVEPVKIILMFIKQFLVMVMLPCPSVTLMVVTLMVSLGLSNQEVNIWNCHCPLDFS